MPQPRIKEEDKPVVGERVEVWDYKKSEFVVHEIKSVLHHGMKGWTIETSMGLYMDVVPTNYDSTIKPLWREYRG